MDLKMVFRISAVIALINGVGSLFMTSTFFEMANLTISPSLVTLGQFIGVTMLFLALVQWRIPDIAGDALSSLGQLFAIGFGMWFLIVGYHIMTGAASGATAYVNLVIMAILAVLFFMKSRKTE
jgi:drug/metabolite transporter (DMT)-like permease